MDQQSAISYPKVNIKVLRKMAMEGHFRYFSVLYFPDSVNICFNIFIARPLLIVRPCPLQDMLVMFNLRETRHTFEALNLK